MGYSREVVNALQRMASFIFLIYAAFFLKASQGEDDPANDLNLYKQLFIYKDQDEVFASKSLEILQSCATVLSPLDLQLIITFLETWTSAPKISFKSVINNNL